LARLALEGTSLCIASIRVVVGTVLMRFGFWRVLLFELRSPMTAMQRVRSLDGGRPAHGLGFIAVTDLPGLQRRQ
jgi:hypothetical protein